jgi:hypothetical protein
MAEREKAKQSIIAAIGAESYRLVIQSIIAAIGAERYRAAYEEIHTPDPKTSLHQLGFNYKVPYEIGEVIWGSSRQPTYPALAWIHQQLSDVDKVELTLQFFREIPTHYLLEYLHTGFEEGLSAEARKRFWEQARAYLSHKDELLANAMGSNISSFFDTTATVEEAWVELTGEDASEKQLEQVLCWCASVPSRLGVPFYLRLLKSAKWHPFIFRSLLNSSFRVCDVSDKKELLAILQQLNLNPIDAQVAQRLSVSAAKLPAMQAHLQKKLENIALVDKKAVIAAIGDEKYQAACKAARKTAPGTGSQMKAADLDYDILFKIEECIWESGLIDAQKVDLTFQVYRDMPCYHFIANMTMWLDEFSLEARSVFWEQVRAFLSQEDEALADPVAYSMWCDLFEDHGHTKEAWRELTREDANDLLQRVLIASGPIPFTMKEPLYARLIGDQKWHYYLYRSLLHSKFDILGTINTGKAKILLDQLDLPADTEHLHQLRAALQEE